jgi:hypothetical protein
LPGTSGERTEVAVTPEPSYADRVAAPTFEGVEWTREKILENEPAVWLTEEALVSMLHYVGFASTEKVVFPRESDTWWSDPRRDSRLLLVASSPRQGFRSRLFPGH